MIAERLPKPFDVVVLGGALEVQFLSIRGLRLLVFEWDGHPTFPGWWWVAGYELSGADEVGRRYELLVPAAGPESLVSPSDPHWPLVELPGAEVEIGR